jgi:membrane protein DedA with SNARE-associated domain
MFASAAGIPTGVPITVVLMLSGAYLIGSLPGLAMTIVTVAAAELGGTLVLHFIGRSGGARLLERLSRDRQERVHATFARWRGRLGERDVATIAVLRLIPFVRMGTTVGAGVIGIRPRDFILGSSIAAIIWTGIPLSVGYAFRSRLETLEAFYNSALAALPMTLGFATLILITVVLGRSAATRARARELLAPIWPSDRVPNSDALPLSDIPQETPPIVH